MECIASVSSASIFGLQNIRAKIIVSEFSSVKAVLSEVLCLWFWYKNALLILHRTLHRITVRQLTSRTSPKVCLFRLNVVLVSERTCFSLHLSGPLEKSLLTLPKIFETQIPSVFQSIKNQCCHQHECVRTYRALAVWLGWVAPSRVPEGGWFAPDRAQTQAAGLIPSQSRCRGQPVSVSLSPSFFQSL